MGPEPNGPLFASCDWATIDTQVLSGSVQWCSVTTVGNFLDKKQQHWPSPILKPLVQTVACVRSWKPSSAKGRVTPSEVERCLQSVQLSWLAVFDNTIVVTIRLHMGCHGVSSYHRFVRFCKALFGVSLGRSGVSIGSVRIRAVTNIQPAILRNKFRTQLPPMGHPITFFETKASRASIPTHGFLWRIALQAHGTWNPWQREKTLQLGAPLGVDSHGFGVSGESPNLGSLMVPVSLL